MAKEDLLKIPLSKLQLGLIVKLPLSWTNHPFLFNRIDIKESAQIALIKSLGVPYVYVIGGQELLADDDEPEVVTEEEFQAEAPPPDQQFEIRKAMRISQQRFIKTINDSRGAFGKIVSDPEGAYRDCASLVENIIEHLTETDSPKLAMVSTFDNDISVTQHGVSVAVIATMIGKAIDLPMETLRDIALGSLFHDLGKLKVPDEIRRKRTELNVHETNFLKMHPKFGYDLLNKCGLYPEPVLDVVLHHHEFQDGSGYPDKLKGAKIPIHTQIVSLANDYEQILNHMSPPSPQVALGYLFKNRAGKHADSLVAVLVKLLGIYPPGTLVRLTDQSVGKVMVTTNQVKQPHVWACETDGSDAKLRLLRDEGTEIEAVIKSEDLTEGSLRILQADASISFYFSSMS